MQRNNTLRKLSSEEREALLREIIPTAQTKTEVLKRMRVSHVSSGNFQSLDRWILKLGIDASHLSLQNVRKRQYMNQENKPFFKKKYRDSSIFKENSTVSGNVVRNRYRTKVEPKCAWCDITVEYNGKPISLQLDHINGIRSDNRMENLRWLCPNCHSQTETFSSRNKKYKLDKPIKPKYVPKTKIEWPMTNILKEWYISSGYEEVGRKLGVSGKAVKKHLNVRGIVLPSYNTPIDKDIVCCSAA